MRPEAESRTFIEHYGWPPMRLVAEKPQRGKKGVNQHCSEKHLHRYLAEFDFRYTNRVGTGVNDEGSLFVFVNASRSL